MRDTVPRGRHTLPKESPHDRTRRPQLARADP
ncbi:hypothetical protein SFR_5514 [Streptomyces sp. FR-008]|nr:hypothetical protein SFR_5514 [Streptomyces sp. FR-008]